MQNQNFFDRSTDGDQILTHEEEFELAGYRPDAVELIDREYLLEFRLNGEKKQSAMLN